MVAAALFYGREQSSVAQDILASFITSLIGTVPQTLVRELFLMAEPRKKDSSSAKIKSKDIVDEYTDKISRLASLRSQSAHRNLLDLDESTHAVSLENESQTIPEIEKNVSSKPTVDAENESHTIVDNDHMDEETQEIYKEYRKLCKDRHEIYKKQFKLPQECREIAWCILIVVSIVTCLTAVIYGLSV